MTNRLYTPPTKRISSAPFPLKPRDAIRLSPLLVAVAIGTADCSRSSQLGPVDAAADPSGTFQVPPHTVQFVKVDAGVVLEVIDWGGSGRPVVLLAGLEGHAIEFRKFGPKLAENYHVFSVTRRGYAPSSIPKSGYSADRLGDDVVALIDALKLDRPVLCGHSIGGEELSAVGTRHPEKVSGLIYLEAGYGYALYDTSQGNLYLDAREAISLLEQVQPDIGQADARPVVDQLIHILPQIQKEIEAESHRRDLPQRLPPKPAYFSPSRAIIAGWQKYTDIHVPVLALFAMPHDLGPDFPGDAAQRAKMEARDSARTGAQADAFERQIPSARVVRIPHASHMIFESNEADVLREVNAFISHLP